MKPDDDPSELGTDEGSLSTADRRRRWHPEAQIETASVLRQLAIQPWLVAGRDDDAMAAVRRNLDEVRATLERVGWVLVEERDLIRLRKSPPPRRFAGDPDEPTPLQASWFFLLVAGAESVAPKAGLAQLVAAARSAAAEASLPVHHDIRERRAIVRALRLLIERGVLEQLDGDADGFVADEDAPVLLAVHHSRLAHVIAHPGALDPAADPATWLAQVESESDPARRMRRRLVDDTIVYTADLDPVESEWLSKRVRGDDGAPLAAAFGLCLERRTEGAAFVVPKDACRLPRELGPLAFPGTGTVPHAALLLCGHSAVAGTPATQSEGPGIGWRRLTQEEVLAHLARLAAGTPGSKGGWRKDLVEDLPRLAHEIRLLLVGIDMVRGDEVSPHGPVWWFSPATARWNSDPGPP